MSSLKLTNQLTWIGSLDPDLRVFDIIMETEFGTTYNSYVLKGSEKTVVIETAKLKTYDQYFKRLSEVCNPSQIDYVVLNHTEPDHAGSVSKLLDLNPNLTIVGTAVALDFMKDIANRPFNTLVVDEGDTLSLGDLTLRFIMAPNLHWPDTMYTYVEETGILFTCDSFGAHYCEADILLSKVKNEDDYRKALKYYYDMILGPFPTFMSQALDKIEHLNLSMICTGHGPVLDVRIPEILQTYRTWSTLVNPNPNKTVILPYVSSYGYTAKMAEAIERGIKAAGQIDVKAYDLVTTPVATVASEIYFADGLVIGTPTILGDALKPLWDLTSLLFPVVHGGKLAAVFGSYGWSGEGVPNLTERLKQLRMDVLDGLSIRFNPDADKLKTCFEFGESFGKRLLQKSVVSGRLRAWKCILCGEVIYSENRPDICPVCGAPAEQFVEIPYEDIKVHIDTQENFVIIGGGAAAVNAAEAIRARNATASITMLSEESRFAYNRPQLTKDLLADYNTKEFLLKDPIWYDEQRIELKLGQKVVQVDTNTRQVLTQSNQSYPYDKLILALGASSFIPPIKGSDKENVVSIRNTQDIDKIKGLIPMVKTAIVVGGGILGLEAAWQLSRFDLKVVILELAPALMTRQLDDISSNRLRKWVESKGMDVHTGVQIQEISGESTWSKGIQLADGRFIEGDLIVMSAGIKANTDLANSMGLKLNRGILVDAEMKTSLAHVYAAGDCAEYGINYAIWPQALEQGRVAGANAAGDELEYIASAPAVSMHALDTTLFALGDPGKDPNKSYQVMDIEDGIHHTSARYFFTEEGLVGGVLMHDISKSIALIEGIAKKIPYDKFIQKL